MNETNFYAQSVTKLAIGPGGSLTPAAVFTGPKASGDDDFSAVPTVFSPPASSGCGRTLVAVHQKQSLLYILDTADLSRLDTAPVPAAHGGSTWVGPPTWSARHGLLYVSYYAAGFAGSGLTAWAVTPQCALRRAAVWQNAGVADVYSNVMQPTVVGDVVLLAGGAHKVFYALDAQLGTLLYTSPPFAQTTCARARAAASRLWSEPTLLTPQT